MRLVVGLGNPGEKYANNRHNVGFMFVDSINRTGEWKESNSAKALYQWINFKGDQIELFKPMTFMNKSGFSVAQVIKKHPQLKPADIIVVHDDLDIPLGKFKIQKGSGPKLHNGLESIENMLKTKDFLRIRIGVDNRDPNNRIDGETYVLQDFLSTEIDTLKITLIEIMKRLSVII